MESTIVLPEEEFLSFPIAGIDKTMAEMKEAMEKGYHWVGWQKDFNGHNGLFYIEDEETAKNFCWSAHPGNYDTAILLRPLYENIDAALSGPHIPGQPASYIDVPISGLQKANPEDSGLAKDYNRLLTILDDMDMLYGDIGHQVRKEIPDFPASITLHQNIYHEDEVIQAALQFKKDESDSFALHSLEMRAILVGDVTINGIRTRELEMKLKSVRDLDYTDDFAITQAGPISREIEGAYNQLAKDDKGKFVIEKLKAKYEYEHFAEASKFETRQYFLATPGLTLDHAINLFMGRDVYMPIPGDKTGLNAWFRLDSTAKDKEGNALLIQYGDQHIVHLKECLNELPLLHKRHSSISIEKLQMGYPVPAHLLLFNTKIQAGLSANPRNGNLKVYSLDNDDYGTELLIMPDTIQRKSFVYAYDSQMNRMPYNTGLPGLHLPDIKSRDRIKDWLEEDTDGHTQKRRI